MPIKGISLFSSAGIGELYLESTNIQIIAANEILKNRSDCYQFFFPNVKMLTGDIRDEKIKLEIISYSKKEAKFLLATPPCQGLSTLGKNKVQKHFEDDHRNFLIFDILDVIDNGDFDYILIENVPRFLKMVFPYDKGLFTLEEILIKKYSDIYAIEVRVLNAKDYGLAQTRPRAIIKMYKKGLIWSWPELEKEITLREAIGHLPELDPGEKSDIPWHFAKEHSLRIVESLRHTETGKSALRNDIFFPKKENGERIKGFHNTFKRMSWDQPAHARTTYCGSISSHNNVHPGRKKSDGSYSDPRVLTLLETFIVSSIPSNIVMPSWANDSFIRTIIGEAIPPLMLKKILNKIKE